MANEVDEFLKSISGESKDDPFTAEPTDPFKKEEVTVVGEDKDKKDEKVPFHEDPKIQKFIKREVEKRIGEIKPTETQTFVKETKSDEVDEVTGFLTRIIGNDTPEKVAAIKDGVKVFSGLEEKGAQKALAQLQAQADEERQAEVQAQKELANGFESIEDEFDVDLTSNTPQAKKERGEFIDFIKRVSPKDEDGQVTQFPDLQETYKVFKDRQKPETNNRAKELSSRSMARSGDASNVTPTGDRSWKAVDKLFSKLG
jgi:hypothetical protein